MDGNEAATTTAATMIESKQYIVRQHELLPTLITIYLYVQYDFKRDPSTRSGD